MTRFDVTTFAIRLSVCPSRGGREWVLLVLVILISGHVVQSPILFPLKPELALTGFIHQIQPELSLIGFTHRLPSRVGTHWVYPQPLPSFPITDTFKLIVFSISLKGVEWKHMGNINCSCLPQLQLRKFIKICFDMSYIFRALYALCPSSAGTVRHLSVYCKHYTPSVFYCRYYMPSVRLFSAL